MLWIHVDHFQLIHVQLSILFKHMTMCDVNDIIVPREILYKESNNRVFVFVLTSVPCCLFPAAMVVQDTFDQFILEYIGLANYLCLCSYEITWICLVQLCFSITILHLKAFLSPILNIHVSLAMYSWFSPAMWSKLKIVII